MKTEDFDDAIKRKLESINPVFNEKDILRVHQYSMRHRSPFSLFKTNRFLWPVMGAGMLITALVTWKITSMNVHSQTAAPVVATQNVQATDAKTGAVKTITKTDTVVVTKYVDKYQGKKLANSRLKNISTNTENTQYRKTEKAVTGAQASISGSNEVPNGEGGNANNTMALADRKNAANLTPGISEAPKTPQAETALPSSAAPVAKADNAVAEKKVTEEKIAKKAPIHNYNEEHKKPSKAKSPVNVNFMAGIGGEATFSGTPQNGLGIYTRTMFNNRISINAGLKMMNVNHQYYGGDADFQQANGYDFKWGYAQGLPYNSDVTGIRFNYTLWQVPLAIEYNLPVGNNYSLSASLGTDLDISCTAAIAYDATEYYGHDQSSTHIALNNNYPTVVFNNAVGSVGIMKQWNHFVVQASPFVSHQINAAWYKGSSSNFLGANLKVFYAF